MPSSTAEQWTLRDAIDHLVDVFDINEGDRPYRSAVRAVLSAYRELPNSGDWSYYTRRGTLSTVASYSTGTVAYDHTGGSYERQLTLSGGTWPSWAQYGQVLIGGVRYVVDDRKSDTVITLSEDANPGADVASGTSYGISRASYPLPVGAISIGGTFTELSTGYELSVVATEQLLDMLRGNYSPSRPLAAAIRASGKLPGRMEVELAPPPSTQRTYEYIYQYRPSRLFVTEESTGTVSVSAGTTTLTCSNAVFTSDMVGSLVRLSADGSTLPTSIAGRLVSGVHTLNPSSHETTVKSVTSTTVLELADAPSATHSNVKYTISDRIDLEAGAMYEYFLRLAELKFARSSRSVDARQTLELEQAAQAALLAALAADSRNHYPNRTGSDVRFYSLSDWDDANG